MNDLNQIISNNAKAGFADVDVQRKQGLFVVTIYGGLSYLSHETFATHHEAAKARDRFNAPSDMIGERATLLLPIDTSSIPAGPTPPTLESTRRAAASLRAQAESEAVAA